MRIMAIYRIFQCDEMLHASIRTIEPFVNDILVLANDRPWQNTDHEYDMGETQDILRTLADDAQVEVVRSSWLECLAQQVQMIDIARQRQATHIFFVDFDEGYFPEDMQRILETVNLYPDYSGYYVRRYCYWKSMRYVIDPIEPTPALVVLDVRKNLRMLDTRLATPPHHLVDGALQHHFSYVRKSDRLIEEKILSFEHGHQVRPLWYEIKWKKWFPDLTMLHPTHPHCFERALPVMHALPGPFEEIKETYDNEIYSRALRSREESGLRGDGSGDPAG
jgi:hypothetical protein